MMQLGVPVYYEPRELVDFLRCVQQLPVPERRRYVRITCAARRRMWRLLVTSAKEIVFYQRLSVCLSVCLFVCKNFM